MREAGVQTHTRLRLAQLGALAYRNNVGACTDDSGRVIRYGLGNDSKQLNDQIKSSDIVGAMPIVIQPHHVGRTMAIFTAVECKHPDWHLTPGDKRAQAQLRFIELIRGVGGIAGFVTDASQVDHLTQSFIYPYG